MALKRADLYWKRHPMEVDWFVALMAKFPQIEFFQPNRDQAPWHVQGRLPNGLLANFWPHTQKAMMQDSPPVRFDAELMLREALCEAPVSLIDDEAGWAPPITSARGSYDRDDDTIAF